MNKNFENKKLIIAIDMGGRTAKVGLSSLTGEILQVFIVETMKGDDAIPHFNVAIREKLVEWGIDYDKQIVAIGFGCVGPLDLEKGISVNAGKIGWYNYPARDVAEKHFKKPVYLINDARAIAVGEWKQGAGRNYHSFIIYSIGTGIGGGIILNNQLFHGSHGLANEFGHGGYLNTEKPCLCGLKGCIEGLSSATGIEWYFQQYIKEHPKSSLANLQRDIGRAIEIKDLSPLLHERDKDAMAAMSHALKPLAGSISMMMFAFDPQAVLIGGGPSALGPILLELINNHLKEMVWKDLLDKIDLKLCETKNAAGMIGVAENTIMELKKAGKL